MALSGRLSSLMTAKIVPSSSMSTGMLADMECQNVGALQLKGFSDNIMRCKACLAVNHGDALLVLNKPSGLFRHCECRQLRKVWCRSHN